VEIDDFSLGGTEPFERLKATLNHPEMVEKMFAVTFLSNAF
jgi:hypothetical protein